METILEADDKPPKKEPTEKAIVEDAIKKAEKDLQAVKDNHDKAREDLKFAFAEDQWDADVKSQRAGRPCLTINKLPANADKVEGDLRRNKISIKVIPWNGQASEGDAKVRAGVIRNIEEISDAQDHYVTAGYNAAVAGKGILRAYTRYIDDDTFDQELRIMAIENPLSVVFDSEAKMVDKSDANHAFIFDTISRSEFKRRWKKEPCEFTTDMPKEMEKWVHEDEITIAEYFLKVPIKKTLYKVQNADGSFDVIDDPGELDVIDEREIETYKIEWRVIDGQHVLEGPIEWPGRKYIPLVEIPGKKVNIDGSVRQRGMFRYAKDPMKMYNYWASASTEAVALAPKSPWLLTGAMVAGYEEVWKKAHLENYPYLPYNIDPKNPNAMPKREQPGNMPVGMIDERRLAGDEIKDTIGRHEAALGMRSNETSGKAIVERAARSELGDLAFSDNLARAVKHLGRILLDAMPRVYDTERLVRIVHSDEQEEWVVLNKTMNEGEVLRDMSSGRYEVKVEVGPHYNSRQAEALDGMIQFTQYNPNAGMFIGDLVAEASNWPNKEKVAARFRKMMKIDEPDQQQQAQVQQAIQQGILQGVEQYKQGPMAKKAEAEAMEAAAQAQEAQAKAQEAQANAQEAQIKIELTKEELVKRRQETLLIIEKREQLGKE